MSELVVLDFTGKHQPLRFVSPETLPFENLLLPPQPPVILNLHGSTIVLRSKGNESTKKENQLCKFHQSLKERYRVVDRTFVAGETEHRPKR